MQGEVVRVASCLLDSTPGSKNTATLSSFTSWMTLIIKCNVYSGYMWVLATQIGELGFVHYFGVYCVTFLENRVSVGMEEWR